MTDFHSHILPGIDDGSKNVNESVVMLAALADIGFERVIMTPHFYPEDQSVRRFDESRGESLEQLKAHIKMNAIKNLPQLEIGSEVYLQPLLFSSGDDELEMLTVGKKGKIMLVEMEYTDTLTDFTVSALNRIIYNIGIIPVLAHIERYPFMYDEKIFEKLLEMGCYAQINVTSLSSLLRRRKLLKYLHKGYICEIGSDIHSPSSVEAVRAGFGELSDKDKEIIKAESRKMSGSYEIQTFFN